MGSRGRARTPVDGAARRRGAPHDRRRTVLAAMAQYWLYFGVKYGLEPDALCAASGIRPSDIADRDRQIPHAWLAGVRAAVIAGLPEVAVGLELGTFASPDQFGYAGQLLKYCATPKEALTLLVRFCALMDSAFREAPMSFHEGRRTVELRVPRHPSAAHDPPECIEAVFVSHVSMMRASTNGAPVRPCRVCFRHARDGAVRGRLEGFFGSEVTFSARLDAMVFDRVALERPILGADANARRRFEAQVGKLANAQAPFAAVVAREVEARLGRGDLSQACVAKRFGMGARSLQRALKTEGESYGDVVAGARKAIALRLLQDPNVALYEVALAVGYEDVRCLDRSFRRWMGVTPRKYRDGALESFAEKGT